MTRLKPFVIAALAGTMIAGSANAATITFNNRAAFEATLSNSFTDTYDTTRGYAPGFSITADAPFSAIVGQTRYQTTGFSNLNIIQSNGTYCAGCNGSFNLFFDGTTFGTINGVQAVGFDSPFNGGFDALVTFGDNSAQLYALAVGNTPTFFGLTSDKLIKSIAFGPGGQRTNSVSFVLDNLTIGNAVPEPATWAMMILGFGMVGAAARRRRQIRVVTA
jgi:PEP-CTERM motif